MIYSNPLCKKREYHNIVLLIVSLGFYTWDELVFVYVMRVVVAMKWIIALHNKKTKKKDIIIFGSFWAYL